MFFSFFFFRWLICIACSTSYKSLIIWINRFLLPYLYTDVEERQNAFGHILQSIYICVGYMPSQWNILYRVNLIIPSNALSRLYRNQYYMNRNLSKSKNSVSFLYLVLSKMSINYSFERYHINLFRC